MCGVHIGRVVELKERGREGEKERGGRTIFLLPINVVSTTHEIDRETHWLSGTATWAPRRRLG